MPTSIVGLINIHMICKHDSDLAMKIAQTNGVVLSLLQLGKQ